MIKNKDKPLLATVSRIVIVACVALTAGHAMAQETKEAEKDSQVVIVVGTPGGRGINKVNASYAVTNINSNDLTLAAPKSSSEVLALVPGIWVESTGGVSGANVFVRGFPAGGDAEFLTYSLQGTPIYPPSTLSFLENTTMFRVDETIARVEALRGGPNPIFSNGQPGVTANFVLKEGSDVTKGAVKATFTDYGTRRVDALMSGKLADDLYYMVGGYATSSPGIRDTQFESEVGNQLTINITKKFDGGKLNVYTRATDDHGAWYLPFAVNVPGLELGTYTQLGNYSRYATLTVNQNGDTETFDFANGRGWKGTVSGVNFDKSLANGWSIRNHFGYTQGNADTYGLVGDGSAIKASALATSLGTAVTTADGRTLGANDYVQNWGHWVVQKHVRAITNDLSVSKTFGNHDLTAGYYTSSFTSDDFWSLGNFTPFHVAANGNYLNSTITCADLATAGSGSGCWHYGIRSGGDSRVNAFYLADSWSVSQALRIDLGIRNESMTTDYVLDSGPGYPDGTTDKVVHDERSKTSYTIGVNYSLNDSSGVFARTSTGYKYPSFDNFREGMTDNSLVTQYEAGYKLSTGDFDLFATAFANKFEGAKFAVIGGTLESNTNEAQGLEVDARWRTDFGLTVSMNGTVQKTKITNSSISANIGNEAQRQPKVQVRISPSYRFKAGEMPVSLYGTVQMVGDRYSDNANAVKLSGYTKLDAGVIFDLGDFDVQLAADNLTDEQGLTEGDPRSSTSANARPIFGRSYRATIGYKF